MFVCPICGNYENKYIGILNGKRYCRKCIGFKGKKAVRTPINNEPILKLNYELSKKQKEISSKIVKAMENKKNVFLYAITGAGKTELVYQAIYECLKKGKKVGFTVPRKDVVIDLLPRFQTAFKNSKVVAVYGGHNKHLEGDIVIFTTHQLHRYVDYFDYLIFDEIDAFPYDGNEVLEKMFEKSIRGNYVMMSATPRKETINKVLNDNGIYLELLRRYHDVDLPIPKIKLSCISFLPFLIYKLKKYQAEKKQCFIFTPTIKEAEMLYSKISFFVKNGNVVHSKKETRNEIISDFKEKKYDYLITTSVLERGVTVKNLQVIIYKADHELYDEASLIQISGRVGRKIDAPSGDVWLLGYKKTVSMINAVKNIESINKCRTV